MNSNQKDVRNNTQNGLVAMSELADYFSQRGVTHNDKRAINMYFAVTRAISEIKENIKDYPE